MHTKFDLAVCKEALDNLMVMVSLVNFGAKWQTGKGILLHVSDWTWGLD
jgi:hypothetical protein